MDKEYILKHKNFDVAVFNIDDQIGITRIKKIFLKERLPLGCVTENIVSEKRIKEWWNDRGIPINRENYKYLLKEFRDGGKNKWLIDSSGLSLTDHYWVTDKNNKWEEVNYYENSFDNVIGEVIIGRKKKESITIKENQIKTPDGSTDGNLAKRWFINVNGERILEKGGRRPYLQEPANEVIADLFCKKLDIFNVTYEKINTEDGFVSRCPNMTDEENEFQSCYGVYDILALNAFKDSKYEHMLKCLEKINVENAVNMLDKMIILDYLIVNKDRHYRNFGILRNSNNLNEYKFAPIFDNGNSLFHKDGESIISLPVVKKLGDIETFDTLENQLNLIKNWKQFDFNKLEGIWITSKDILLDIPTVEKNRAEKIEKVIEKRVHDLWEIANKK